MGTTTFWDRMQLIEKAREWESDCIDLFEPVGGTLIRWKTWEFHVYESRLHIFLQNLRFLAFLFPPSDVPSSLPDFPPSPPGRLWATWTWVHRLMASSKYKLAFPFLLSVPAVFKQACPVFCFPIFVLSFLFKKVFFYLRLHFLFPPSFITSPYLIWLSTHCAARKRKIELQPTEI